MKLTERDGRVILTAIIVTEWTMLVLDLMLN